MVACGFALHQGLESLEIVFIYDIGNHSHASLFLDLLIGDYLKCNDLKCLLQPRVDQVES